MIFQTLGKYYLYAGNYYVERAVVPGKTTRCKPKAYLAGRVQTLSLSWGLVLSLKPIQY